jgi:hypothetical protein
MHYIHKPKPQTMPQKLSSRQQAQVAFLELLPQKFQRIYSVIEQMAGPRVDEALARGLGLSLGGLADTAGRMGMLVRGGGGMPMKVRGLRELQGSLKINYDAALRSATTPDRLAGEEAEDGPPV